MAEQRLTIDSLSPSCLLGQILLLQDAQERQWVLSTMRSGFFTERSYSFLAQPATTCVGQTAWLYCSSVVLSTRLRTCGVLLAHLISRQSRRFSSEPFHKGKALTGRDVSTRAMWVTCLSLVLKKSAEPIPQKPKPTQLTQSNHHCTFSQS